MPKTATAEAKPPEGNVEVVMPEGKLLIVGPLSLLRKVLDALDLRGPKGNEPCAVEARESSGD